MPYPSSPIRVAPACDAIQTKLRDVHVGQPITKFPKMLLRLTASAPWMFHTKVGTPASLRSPHPEGSNVAWKAARLLLSAMIFRACSWLRNNSSSRISSITRLRP